MVAESANGEKQKPNRTPQIENMVEKGKQVTAKWPDQNYILALSLPFNN